MTVAIGRAMARAILVISLLAVFLCGCGKSQSPMDMRIRRPMQGLECAIHLGYGDGVLTSGTQVADVSDCLNLLSPKYISGSIDDYTISTHSGNITIGAVSLAAGMGIMLSCPYGLDDAAYQKVVDALVSCQTRECVEEVILEHAPPNFMFDRRNKRVTPDAERSAVSSVYLVWCVPHEDEDTSLLDDYDDWEELSGVMDVSADEFLKSYRELSPPPGEFVSYKYVYRGQENGYHLLDYYDIGTGNSLGYRATLRTPVSDLPSELLGRQE